VQLVILEDGSARPFGRAVPATIGMHLPMRVDASAILWPALYRGLLDGLTLGTAVGVARKAIDHDTPGSRQWALPMLTMTAADGPLYAVKPEKEQTARGRPEVKGAARSAVELRIATRNRDALRQRAAESGRDVPDFVARELADAEAAVARLADQIEGEA
jgi:hypothetical protein